jgi:peptidoglycan/xylan/chitin deacetylase (PgdA/CDA1 family)
VTAHFNLIGFIPNPTKYANGVVTFSFDDGYASQHTTARAKLDQYGFPATTFIVIAYLGLSGRVTLDQLRAERDYSGWEVAPHATNGTIHGNRLTTLTEEQLEAEFTELRTWFSANGFSPDVFAYPGGEFNNTVLLKARQHFIGSRTVYQYPETLPPADSAKIRTNAYLSSTSVLATVQAAIDQAYANKEWLHIVAHNVIDTPVQSTDVATATFNSIVDYVASKGIAVATMGDVLRNTP